jgi:hypothetical protein
MMPLAFLQIICIIHMTVLQKTMPNPQKLRPYLVKKAIVELKHSANLLHSQKARPALNDIIEAFDRVNVVGTGGGEDSIQLVSDKHFYKLVVEWSRLVMSIENASDVESAGAIFKKYLAPLPGKLGITAIKRFGVRTMFLLPYDGSVEDLIEFCKSKLYRNLEAFAAFGEIKDVGLVALRIKDPTFKTNLTVGPFSTEEVRAKISEFKDYRDDFESALMLDVDLYQEVTSSYKVGHFIQNALESARLKVMQFREQILKD